MKRVMCVLLGVILSTPAFCATWFEVGALWHDGRFAPFACLTDSKLALGLMRNGTGYGDDRSIYLTWVELRGGDLAVMAGARINLIVKDVIDTRHHLTLESVALWPLSGWWIGWEDDKKFARGGQIFTWHGEGWAIWPLVELGFPIR